MNATAATAESSQIVRLARLEIDPGQLESYQAALKEEIEASVRVEPGVLALNAVAEKEHPNRITLLEIYADADAYQAHLKSPHFLQYKLATQAMVKSLELIETVPLLLSAKSR